MDMFVPLAFGAFVVSTLVMWSRSEAKNKRERKAALRGRLADAKSDEAKIDALIALGDFLHEGVQGSHDQNEEAVKCYEDAAALNSKVAYRRLAAIQVLEHNAYLGFGRLEKAFDLDLKAAELGLDESMQRVSECYANGRGVLKNIGQSTFWLLRSAESGNVDSMVKVAQAYVSGFGTQENPMEGLAWLYVAEHKSNSEAKGLIKNAESNLNSALILMAQDRAKALLDLVKEGRRTSPSALPGNASVFAPGQPPVSKPRGSAKGSGSGAVISPSGHIATAAHVIKGCSYIEVVTPTGTFPATVLNCDDLNDVALLKVDQAFATYIPVGRSSEVRLGQSVATIGFPNIGIQGHSPKVTQGMISGENGIQNDIRLWQISVPIQPGNSGGPLLDDKGRMVGVVVATLSLRAVQITGSVPQNVNYAIKGAYLEPLLNFNKLAISEESSAPTASFQDMVAAAQKASVLILVY